ncbi:calmodulin-like protein 2 [Telopea speciosissima]|uniref:calmodulin-like protein 2 n=1 Tax=Telopea speciosissima TaxID=54955 RepID=UPI001CC41F36|nr:calmodulin-like protein 2 [Telopea speciosissima]
MVANKSHFVGSIYNFVGSLLFSGFIGLLIEFQQFYSKFEFFVNTHIDLLFQKVSLYYNEVRNLETCSKKGCKYCGEYEGFLAENEINRVMDKLGLERISEESGSKKDNLCRKCWVLQGAFLFLEEKEASTEELEEAFSVFDQNKDGILDANELHYVLNKLELKEGAKLEDCEEMIRAYDLNGDGRIELSEFKYMLENAN